MSTIKIQDLHECSEINKKEMKKITGGVKKLVFKLGQDPKKSDKNRLADYLAMKF